jgi:hypothetical protein
MRLSSKKAGLEVALPFCLQKHMKNFAILISWGTIVLVLTHFAATVLESVLRVKINY